MLRETTLLLARIKWSFGWQASGAIYSHEPKNYHFVGVLSYQAASLETGQKLAEAVLGGSGGRRWCQWRAPSSDPLKEAEEVLQSGKV